MRRIIDIVVSLGALIVLLPCWLIAAMGVVVSGGLPVIYRQNRVGRFGHPFQMLKFRTMEPGVGGPSVTARDDPRITRFGRVLRFTKMDELPQLWNVLRGEMTLVGPRPEVPQYVAHYTPEQRRVLDAKPGLTGPTQLQFRDEEVLLAGQADPESFYIDRVMPMKLALDLAYVQNQSLGEDLGVMWRTVRALMPRLAIRNTGAQMRVR